MPSLGYFHPQIVHFVIAGAGLGIFFRWVSLTGKVAWTDRAATALIVIGAVASWFAVASGDSAHGFAERIPGVAAAVSEHEEAGDWTRAILTALAVIELVALAPRAAKYRRWLVVTSSVIGLAAAGMLYRVGDLGGDLVYEYAGGVGMRSGDSTDVNHMVLAALYNRAQLYRTQKNADGAAQAFADLAARYPGDETVQLLHVESLLQDRKDYAGALAELARLPAPADTARIHTRWLIDRADALAGAGQADSARRILSALAQKFPGNKRIQDRLQRLR